MGLLSNTHLNSWEDLRTRMLDYALYSVVTACTSAFSYAKLSAGKGNVVINYNYITIDAKNVKEFNDVVNLFSNQRMALRRT